MKTEENQLTLGQLIEKLKPIVTKQAERKEEACVYFDFGSAVPAGLDSYRGYYDQLALGYVLTGHDWCYRANIESPDAPKVSFLLKQLEAAVGETYQGWKGGHFTMRKETNLWVSNPGNNSSTVIVDVIDEEYMVILVTKYQNL